MMKVMDGSIIVTYRCPMRCKMCDIWNNPTKASEEFKPELLHKLPKMRSVNITGGEPFVREDEPEVLIHSTPFANWTKIKRDGCLKSWNRVKQEMETQEEKPIGHLLGDPEDFRDYIMFGTGERCEIVVSSKEAGRLVDDADEAYHSGARMYFDARKMAADGLLIRDGTHLKVKHGLPLQPYMIWAATWENLGLDSPISTPKRFSHTADSMFEENLHRSAK